MCSMCPLTSRKNTFSSSHTHLVITSFPVCFAPISTITLSLSPSLQMFVAPCSLPLLPWCSVNGSDDARARVRWAGCPVASGSKTRDAVVPLLQERRCRCFDFYNELVPYKDAWSLQKSLVERRHILLDRDEDCSDMLIVLQHCPVYTLGTNSMEEYLNFEMKDAPFDVIRTERGGEVTYHGPGQIVMYPILNLRYHKMDLHWYLRCLEEVVIRVLASSFSIKASRLKGLTGVWVGNAKVAAIGIRVTRWITFHGLALNVSPDLSPFQHIVPCGIKDRQVGSVEEILGRSHGEQSCRDLITVAHKSLLKEFSEVFQLSLSNSSLPPDVSLKDPAHIRIKVKNQT